MKNFGMTIAFAISLLLVSVKADLCAMGSKEIHGNWFCQAVQAIQYSNVGIPGTYNQITEMASNGVCSSQPKHFSGPISPLDEEVSLHFRGPLQLKQFAAYTPSSPKTVKKVRDTTVHQRAHQHVHNHLKAKRGLHGEKSMRQIVTATIDGQVVTWENNWHGLPSLSPSSCVPPAEVTATIDGQVVSWLNNWSGGGPAPTCTSSNVASPPAAPSQPVAQPPVSANTPLSTLEKLPASASTAPAANVDPPPPPGPGLDSSQVYERIAYYDSESQTNDNLVFLGNYGGQGSGVFDYNFGASLAYANSAGTGGASSPQILADTTIPSDSEVIVMLAESCGDNDCGYVRPGAVAYHGFNGADKVFMMEYSMPMDGKSGFNADMPAIWMLNAQIPRTLQYGNPACSCWTTGCGEFDIAEALFQGSSYLKSTLHTNTPGGDSDYLERPTSGTVKLAVVFSSSSSTIHIQVLPDDTTFSASLAASEINGMCQQTASNLVSYITIS